MKRCALLTVCLIFAALACGGPSGKDKDPEPLPPDAALVVKGNNAFALDLYNRLGRKDGNLFFSPYSISTALAMTYAGARNDTADEMAKALHFTLDQDRLHPAFAALTRQESPGGKNKKRGYQLRVANALWGQTGYDFKAEFVKLTKDSYGAGLEEVDFKGATEEARKKINRWVEERTDDKIQKLFKEGVLNRDTRLVLANAIYFKGDWATKFRMDRTFAQPFNASSEKKVRVPMMHETAEFGYLEEPDLQVLAMPYSGKDLSMVVLLPKVDGLADLEKSLTHEKLEGWVGKLRDRKVEVAFPKFKMTSEFSLASDLSALGMKKAFTASADFSGMNGRTDLFIHAVVHKAFVEVNEEGTEAAAATGVAISKSAAPEHPVFRADRPFLFLIRDNRSGSILFLGRVANPAQ